MRIALLSLLPVLALAQPIDRPWNQDVIYFALTDRFFDGDPANDVPAGSDPALFDKTQQDIDKYHGGDLRGLEIALQDGYFNDLGATAIWITPPVRNVWYSKADLSGPKTGYHGYWAQDFLDIDPHLTSAASLDGKTKYPDNRDGRMQHYKDFVALAHTRGIKIIQDVVLNHAGPVFYYDVNGNSQFDLDEKSEWIQPFRAEGFYENAHWVELPKWNAVRPGPAGPLTILGKEVKTTGVLADLNTYGKKGYSDGSLGREGESRDCDFFSLRDIWTEPKSPHFDRLVDEFVEIYAFYLEEIGVDGLRIDTVKHFHLAFLSAFVEKLRDRLGPERAKQLLICGEVYDGDPTKIGAYTYKKDWPTKQGVCLDSVLNFPFCNGVRGYLRPVVGPYQNANSVENAWRSLGGMAGDRPKFNPKPGKDGLTPRQKLINFVENHDGLNRFRVGNISEKQSILANAIAILSEGIPCLYYGAEAGLQDTKGKVGADSETGRLTLVPVGLKENFGHIRKTTSFQAIAALDAIREKLPVLQSGITNPIWSDSPSSETDDGVFAFVRYTRGGKKDEEEAADIAIVVINASERPRVTSAGPNRMRLVSISGRPLAKAGQKLVRLPVAGLDAPNVREQRLEILWHDNLPQVELVLAPQSVNIYQLGE